MREHEIAFYKQLAQEIKPLGFRCFLYHNDTFAWLYVITPNDSLLYIDEAEFSGYNIAYEYKPTAEFGSGCRCNENPLYEITAETLLKAEQYGKGYGYEGWVNVLNQYDGKRHREKLWRTPTHYSSGLAAMQELWCTSKLVEL